MIDLDHFILPESPDAEDYLIGTYLLRKELKDPEEILKLAVMMAAEQTTGTWIRVPGESADVIERFLLYYIKTIRLTLISIPGVLLHYFTIRFMTNINLR